MKTRHIQGTHSTYHFSIPTVLTEPTVLIVITVSRLHSAEYSQLTIGKLYVRVDEENSSPNSWVNVLHTIAW